MEDQMPLVPEMSPEEKQILADLEREQAAVADAETKDAIHSFLSESKPRLLDEHVECRPKQAHKHLRELALALPHYDCEKVHLRVTIDPVASHA